VALARTDFPWASPCCMAQSKMQHIASDVFWLIKRGVNLTIGSFVPNLETTIADSAPNYNGPSLFGVGNC
jgi:hypothetical protein